MEKDLSDFYEISRCVDAIKSGNFEKVALQFPDSFLADSAAVTSLIENKTSKRAFVLADTSYGSCCIDEVAAEHVNADLIIHYGRACLSQTRRLPVLHVFGKWPISIQHCSEQFRQMFPDPCVKVLVFCDVMYSHCIGELENSIKGYYPNIIFSKLVYSSFENELKGENSANTIQMHSVEGRDEQGDTKKPEKNYFNKFGREFRLPLETQLEDYSMFYIGGESLCLTNLMMFYNKCQFYSYDPVTDVGRKETVSVNKALMKRYYMIERAKDAQVIGIVVGTLGVADYLQSIERLKKVIKLAGKKSYLFVMGKLNVAKMANFMEIDVFVLVACPENTLIDSKEFYKPIVTPFEMELACIREREWTGDYITDFRDLLPGASASVELDEEGTDQSSDSADVSLITGKLRVTYDSSREDAAGHSSRSLVERNQETTLSTRHHTSAGAPRVKPFTDKITLNLAEYLSSRSWRGLEQKQGETPVTKAVEGRKGIAAGYTHEEGQKQDSSESTSS